MFANQSGFVDLMAFALRLHAETVIAADPSPIVPHAPSERYARLSEVKKAHASIKRAVIKSPARPMPIARSAWKREIASNRTPCRTPKASAKNLIAENIGAASTMTIVVFATEEGCAYLPLIGWGVIKGTTSALFMNVHQIRSVRKMHTVKNVNPRLNAALQLKLLILVVFANHQGGANKQLLTMLSTNIPNEYSLYGNSLYGMHLCCAIVLSALFCLLSFI